MTYPRTTPEPCGCIRHDETAGLHWYDSVCAEHAMEAFHENLRAGAIRITNEAEAEYQLAIDREECAEALAPLAEFWALWAAWVIREQAWLDPISGRWFRGAIPAEFSPEDARAADVAGIDSASETELILDAVARERAERAYPGLEQAAYERGKAEEREASLRDATTVAAEIDAERQKFVSLNGPDHWLVQSWGQRTAGALSVVHRIRDRSAERRAETNINEALSEEFDENGGHSTQWHIGFDAGWKAAAERSRDQFERGKAEGMSVAIGDAMLSDHVRERMDAAEKAAWERGRADEASTTRLELRHLSEQNLALAKACEEHAAASRAQYERGEAGERERTEALYEKIDRQRHEIALWSLRADESTTWRWLQQALAVGLEVAEALRTRDARWIACTRAALNASGKEQWGYAWAALIEMAEEPPEKLARMLANGDAVPLATCGECERLRATRAEHIASYLNAAEDLMRSELRGEALETAARALLESLPKCSGSMRAGHGQGAVHAPCRRIATRALVRGAERYCDEHGAGVPEYPRAQPIRDLEKLLAGSGGGEAEGQSK